VECGLLRGASQAEVRRNIGHPTRRRGERWTYDLEPLLREGLHRQRLVVLFAGDQVERARIDTLPDDGYGSSGNGFD
jgi:hypothetical protein